MAHEVEFDVRVNKEGDREEVILKQSGGAPTIVFYPEGKEQGYFKAGKARGVFTMVEAIPETTEEAPAKKGK
jgi:hypothetical protein